MAYRTILIPMTALALLSACSKLDEGGAFDNESTGAAADAPDIAPSAAPDVAFSYAYRFALAAEGIAAVQEKHAAACEALGLARCRITSVRYSRSGTDRTDAMLELALAPDIARKFGKDATAIVEGAKGELRALEIGGEDRGAELRQAHEAAGDAETDIARLEASLRDARLTAQTRLELERQLAAQRAAGREAARRGEETRALLASTPMRFVYSTDGFMPGLSIDGTARAALGFAAEVLNALLALVIVLTALAIPLGLLLLGLAHGRRLAERAWRLLAPPPLAEAAD